MALFFIAHYTSSSLTCAAGETYGGLIIGVPGEGFGSFPATMYSVGAIHVLHGSSDGITASKDQFWTQDSPGILGDSEAHDLFGNPLAVGDFNGDNTADVAIGIPVEDVSNLGSAGAVNVLYGTGSKFSATGNQLWTQASPDIEGAAESGDRFGSALAVGDFNGDNTMDLAIGVPSEDVNLEVSAGAVNIIYGSTQGLTSAGNQLLLQTSSSDGVEREDRFGLAIAAGDFNGDSYCDLVVGVPGEDPGSPGISPENGAITVWYGSFNGLIPPATGLEVIHRGWPGIPLNSGEEAFGSSLAVGNFNGDAYDDIAIGSPGADLGALSRVGEINVLYGSSSGLYASSPWPQLWRQDLIGGSGTPEEDDKFGSVLASGDINGDGFSDLAIGVPDEAVGAADMAGAVHVLYGSSSGLTDVGNIFLHQNLSIIPGSPEFRDFYSKALALGDINGDGYADLAIGIPGENLDAGMVNVLYGSSGGITPAGNQLLGQHWPSIQDKAENNDLFGAALAIFPHPALNNAMCFPIKAKNGKVVIICL